MENVGEMEAYPRLYRSIRFKRVGGVCAGLALSRGWSISLVRLITLALMLATGVAFLLYLCAWFFIPPATIDQEPLNPPADPLLRSRRDRVVSGLCGGLAHYLKKDPALIRILVAMAILCTGFVGIAYLYGWAVVPEGEQV